jgi:hypothetical protein
MQERGTLPQEIRVLKEDVGEEAATLAMEGLRRDRETDAVVRSRGTVILVREDGTWRIRREEWADTRTEQIPGPHAGKNASRG